MVEISLHLSGQITIFHQPRFPWIKGIPLTKPPFGVRSCDVAIIWPDLMDSKQRPEIPGSKIRLEDLFSPNFWDTPRISPAWKTKTQLVGENNQLPTTTTANTTKTIPRTRTTTTITTKTITTPRTRTKTTTTNTTTATITTTAFLVSLGLYFNTSDLT